VKLLSRRRPTAEETFAYDPAREDAGARPPGRFRAALTRVGKAVLKVLAAYYVLCVLLLVAYRFVPPPVTGVQLQRGIEALLSGHAPVQRQHRVRLDAMSRHLPRAVVAAEDGRYWTHWGFDLKEMWSAGGTAVGGGRMRGASTITQQLMKNLFGCACRPQIREGLPDQRSRLSRDPQISASEMRNHQAVAPHEQAEIGESPDECISQFTHV